MNTECPSCGSECQDDDLIIDFGLKIVQCVSCFGETNDK